MVIAGIEQREISALFLLPVVKNNYNKSLEKVKEFLKLTRMTKKSIKNEEARQ